MCINLLAGSAIGLFIGMLIIMIIVVLLFGFLTYMIFKQTKKPTESANVYDVKRMLARRETRLTLEIMNSKDDEAKKTELINKLRRVRSAETLVDELLEEEKAISGITDPAEENEKPKKPHLHGKNGQRPAGNPAQKSAPSQSANPAQKSAPPQQAGNPAQKSVPPQQTGNPAASKPAEKSTAPAAEKVKPSEQPVVKSNVQQVKKPEKKETDSAENKPSDN